MIAPASPADATDKNENIAPEPRYESLEGNAEYSGPDINQSEAGGIAWVDVYLPTGAKISLTERRSTAVQALDALMYAIQYGQTRYGLATKGMSVTFSQSPAATTTVTPAVAPLATAQPKPVAPVAHSGNVYKVVSVKHIRNKSQKHMVVCALEGSANTAFAFDKHMPSDVDFMSWGLFEEFGPPNSMAYAVIDPVKNWVISFQSHP